MPIVKRFRKLGEIKTNKSHSEETIAPPPPIAERKTVHRFRTRATRCDKKHRFTLRIAHEPWTELKELSINCGASDTGASLNKIANLLIEYALNNPDICAEIQSKYPNPDQVIKIRTWG